MPHLMLAWQTAAVGAALLLVVGWLGVRFGRRRWIQVSAPFVRESGVILALYALWQYIGGFSLRQTDHAVARGQWIWDTERSLHLPDEAWLQDGIVHHSFAVQACNIYYATMHFGMLIAVLLWLYGRHRSAYPRVRATIVVTTTACLLVGLVPVAPPRLVHVGMIDTAAAYGQSVYSLSTIGADQYSAMPSVHVAWAALVAAAVIMVGRSRWRWLILLHFVATVYVVVVTANHFWADGIVAVALLGLSLGVQLGMRWLLGWLGLRQLYASTAAARVERRPDDVEVG
jgi:hypothetical protein